MRARFIYEKFEEDSDPIQDMGIGLTTKNILNMILEEDQKIDLMDGRFGKNNIYGFKIWSAGRWKENEAGTRIVIYFFEDRFYVPGKTYKNGNKKVMTPTQLIEYTRSLFENVGLGDMITGGKTNYHASHCILFYLTPKYRKILKPIEYFNQDITWPK